MPVFLRIFVLSMVCWMFGASVFAAEVPAKERITILVTIDGFPDWMLNDPALVMPTLKKFAANGATGPMKISNPTVTWPNHTTLVTGVDCSKHGVLYNGMMLRQGPGKPNKFEQWRDKKDMVRVPTVYDAAFKAGLTTFHADWPASQKSGTFSWEFTELSDPKGEIETGMVAAGIMTQQDLDEFRKRNIVFRDEIWTRSAEYVIKKHHPNFMLVHLLTTDSINHKYGPGTVPSFAAYAFVDSCLKRLVEALEAAGYKDKYTFVVTTDHGFKTAKKLIRTDSVLRKEGWMSREGLVIKKCDVQGKSAGGSSMLFISDPAKKEELTPKLKEIFSKIEGIAHVYDPTEYAAIGLPQPKDNDQCGDVFLTAKDGYAFTDAFTEGEVVVDIAQEPGAYPGNHGYLNDDPQLNGAFIAYGYGIKPGVKLERLSNLNVAPLLAKLLNVPLPDADGKVLEEVLESKP